LEVEEPQQHFVSPVANYLALCAYGSLPGRPLAVRVGEEVVGFVMWGVEPGRSTQVWVRRDRRARGWRDRSSQATGV